MRALLIEVDYTTGKRAGGINPKDQNLQCYRWQSLPREDGPDVEIRLVEDDRDLTGYEDIPGVRVLENEEEIDQAIERFIPPKYQANPTRLENWLEKNGLSADFRTDLPPNERLKQLKEVDGADFIQKEDPPKVSEIRSADQGGPDFGSDIGKGRGLPDQAEADQD